ncbi:MAG: Nuclear actin-protein involved in chromatin remodeling [Caeruleum heppii]|nr:MAG: Nuclear actin-protein involved in chromatin remodeling [Caeruleum heppii]
MTDLQNGTASGSHPENPQLPPQKIYTVREPPYQSTEAFEASTRRQFSPTASSDTAIVIDHGSSTVRAGYATSTAPLLSLPPIMARYRDRKLGKTYNLIGTDAYIDATTRGQIRNGFEAGSGVVSNWDVTEGVLDYIFLKLGVDGAEGGIGRGIVMTEAVANLPYTRKTMNEIIFECYGAPSLAYGIDSLFSYHYNGGQNGLVISSSHSSTHVIPVLNSKGLLSQATRLNWGGSQGAEYVLKLLQLKYPTFPGKMTSLQAEEMVREHCYISRDYEDELSKMLDWTGLEDRDHVVQYPFTEQVTIQKTEEELARAAEKRKEGGRRLQEQAAKMRLEKLIKKEQELEYYKDLQQKATTETKKEFRRLLEVNDFDTEAQLDKVVRDLDKSIRKARTKDVGGPEIEEEAEEPTYPLLDIPDDQLDEAGIKQKRTQRLMKSNTDARARAKAEKDREKARIAEEERLDAERRETDLEGWVEERRAAREALLNKLQARQRLKADLSNRKSLASQMRMKSIANLAADTPSSKKRRRGGGDEDDDGFGANDDDWGVYRDIAGPNDAGGSDAEDEDEELGASLKEIEKQLLEYDEAFTEQHTHEQMQKTDWTQSLLHRFLRGPRPYDPESAREANQLHLNVERIRVPEVVFQPGIAGVDQAGLVEICSDILLHRLPSSLPPSSASSSTAPSTTSTTDLLLKDIFLTGGNTLFRNFDERLCGELRAVLPAEAELRIRKARDPTGDAWRGAARWAGGEQWKAKRVLRAEWEECGGEYIKEHDLGNAYSA